MRKTLTAATAIGAAFLAAAVWTGAAQASTQLDEDWSACSTGTWSVGSTHTCTDSWYVDWNDSGSTKIVNQSGSNYLQEQPQTATSSGQSYSALVTSSNSVSNPLYIHNEYQTNQQLRTGSSPNPWEVGWTLFDLNKDSNGIYTFYYVLLKPNGWEIGKDYDNNGVQAQQFLASGTNYTYPVGNWDEITVNNFSYGSGTESFTVQAIDTNGDNTWHTLATVTDSGTHTAPFTSGTVGVYCEDSQIIDGYVNVTN